MLTTNKMKPILRQHNSPFVSIFSTYLTKRPLILSIYQHNLDLISKNTDLYSDNPHLILLTFSRINAISDKPHRPETTTFRTITPCQTSVKFSPLLCELRVRKNKIARGKPRNLFVKSSSLRIGSSTTSPNWKRSFPGNRNVESAYLSKMDIFIE